MIIHLGPETIGDYSSSKRTKQSASKSCVMSILCAVAILFGVPTSFEGIDIHYGRDRAVSSWCIRVLHEEEYGLGMHGGREGKVAAK